MDGRFDPGGFYEFDLGQGAVRTRDGGRVVVLPEAVAKELVRSASPDALGALGAALGVQARASMPDPATASPDIVLGHVAGVVALFGWGRVKLETWGPALVVRTDGAPDAADRGGLAALLEGLFGAVGGSPVAVVPTTDGGGQLAFLVVHPEAAQAVLQLSPRGLAHVLAALEEAS